MAKKFEITLSEENWNKLNELLHLIPDSDFLNFCMLNDIIDKGIKKFKEETSIYPFK